MTRTPAKPLAGFAAGLIVLAAGGAALAQPPHPGAGPGRGAPEAGARLDPQARAAMEQRRAERRAQRNRDLVTVLRLTPAQTGALEAFVASQAPPRRDMRDGPGAGPPEPGLLTTPQRLDEQARRSDERRAFETRRTQGLRDFYAVLSPEQRQVFDALERLRDSGGPGVGHGGPGGPGGPGRPDGPPPPR